MLGVSRNWVNILEQEPPFKKPSRILLMRIDQLEKQAAERQQAAKDDQADLELLEKLKAEQLTSLQQRPKTRTLSEEDAELIRRAKQDSSLGAFHNLEPIHNTPCAAMKKARLAKGLSFVDLAKLTRYKADVLQAIEDGRGKASERMIEAICKALGLEKAQLMHGADEMIVRDPMRGTYGATPDIDTTPGVGRPRYVPLISMAQAGTLSESAFTDGAYEYEGTIAFDVKDNRAFSVKIVGDSMSPVFTEGDVAIIYPSWTPRNGDHVIARLTDKAGGDVMFKLYSTKDSGRRVVLTSYNPAYAPVDFAPDEFTWLYPVVSVNKTLRK